MNDNLSILPNSWQWVKLKDITENIEKEDFRNDPHAYFKYIDISSIDNNIQKIVEHKDYQGKNAPSRARQKIKSNDILFSTVRTYLKNIAMVDPKYDDEIASTGFCVIRPQHPIVSRFIFYYIQTSKFLNPLSNIQRGTSYPAVRNSDVLDQCVPIAPFNEQVRIIDRVEELFSRLDVGVRSLQAAQTRLEQYRQVTLLQAYTGKLTQKWKQDRGNMEYITEEIDIKPYRNLISWDIPQEWKWVSVGSLVDSMQNGIYKPMEFYSDDGVACLRMYNIEDGKIVWKDIKRMILTENEFKKYELKPNDILICRVSGSRELVGKSAIIPNNLEPCVYESKTIRMRLKQDAVSSEYIQYWMHFFSSRYFNLNAQQVLMASISQNQIASMPTPFTSIGEQQKIVETINEVYSYIDNIEGTIDKNLILITQLKNSILKKAFEGKLGPQDPNDEPSSVLLERIKAQRLKQRKLM